MAVVQCMKKSRHEEDHQLQGCLCQENCNDAEVVNFVGCTAILISSSPLIVHKDTVMRYAMPSTERFAVTLRFLETNILHHLLCEHHVDDSMVSLL